MAASQNLQDLRYLSHSGRGVLVGSEDLEPILFFLLLFCPVLCLLCDVFLRPLCVLLSTWGPSWN